MKNGEIRRLIAVAIPLAFLMAIIAEPISADDGGVLNEGTCTTYNGTEYMTGFWTSKTSKGCTVYTQFEGYKDMTDETPNAVWQVTTYLTPENDREHVIEDTGKCNVIRFSTPKSGGQNTIFKTYSPDSGSNYGNSRTVYYTLGITASAKILDGLGSIGANVAISTSTTYYDTSVGIAKMEPRLYEVQADIDDKKDEARKFIAGCSMQRANAGTQSVTVYVEGNFESQSMFGGTDTRITDTRTISFYLG